METCGFLLTELSLAPWRLHPMFWLLQCLACTLPSSLCSAWNTLCNAPTEVPGTHSAILTVQCLAHTLPSSLQCLVHSLLSMQCLALTLPSSMQCLVHTLPSLQCLACTLPSSLWFLTGRASLLFLASVLILSCVWVWDFLFVFVKFNPAVFDVVWNPTHSGFRKHPSLFVPLSLLLSFLRLLHPLLLPALFSPCPHLTWTSSSPVSPSTIFYTSFLSGPLPFSWFF